MPDPTLPPSPSEWSEDLSDAPLADPGASDAIRFAGCAVAFEIELLGAQTS